MFCRANFLRIVSSFWMFSLKIVEFFVRGRIFFIFAKHFFAIKEVYSKNKFRENFCRNSLFLERLFSLKVNWRLNLSYLNPHYKYVNYSQFAIRMTSNSKNQPTILSKVPNDIQFSRGVLEISPNKAFAICFGQSIKSNAN